ncbi:MAG: hypothetical protein ACXVAY_11385 [Mucilaginibacter sp.]
MKVKIFKFSVLTLAIALMVNLSAKSQQTSSDDADKQIKNYSKTYPVDGNDKIQISNSYGKVIVNTWNKNEVKVDVQIKLSGRNSKKQIDDIIINDSKDGQVITFKTNIGKQKNSWSWWRMLGDSFHNMEINYTVYMPAKNALNVTDHYGAIILPDLDGTVNINNAYGSVSAKSLNGADNIISVSYGSANIESIKSVELNIKYGSLGIGSVDKLNANVNYSGVKIAKLNISGNINARYGGGLHIAEVGKGLKNLTVNSVYSDVKIGLANDMNADFNVTVKYGGFNYGGHQVSVMTQTPGTNRHGWSPIQNYIGHLGKGDADKSINISSTYGSVRFE